jgi:opacity protein-like surface antigen
MPARPGGMEGHAMTIRQVLATAALSLSFATSAFAFDTPPPVDAPEITTIDTAEGWYIRGDLGYNGSVDFEKPTIKTFKSSTDTYTSTKFDSARFDSDFTLNAGAGYQFNDWLRSDLTLDYFKGTFDGKSTTNKPCSAIQPNGTKCGSSYEQALASLGLLANAYADLGTYWGLTPYLGAGAGVTNMDYGSMTASKYCISGGGKCDKFTDYKDKSYNGLESWRFTYALMAGFSYDVATNLKLDFGYRYSKVAGGDMFDWSSNEKMNGARGVKGEDDGFSRHEFRAGLRLTGW